MTTNEKLTGDFGLSLYRGMVTIRAFEERVRSLSAAGQVPGLTHLYSGQEAVAVGVSSALQPDDAITSHHRGHGHCLASGADPVRLMAEILGRTAGYGLGRGGSMHILDPATRNLGTNGIVGGGVPLATGAALTAKTLHASWLAVAFFGDGAMNQGIVFECMNMAALWKLPVLYVCENNHYGEFTRIDDVTAGTLAGRAAVFGIPVAEIDGMDVLAVHAAAQDAVARAREGQGPSLLVCDTWRFSGHHAGDKQSYKDDAEAKNWAAKCPIETLGRRLVANKLADADSLSALRKTIEADIAAVAEQARAMPEPASASLEDHLHG
ncbi:MAG: ABC transporter substrate-binding protein [Rhizobiales bacterium]|nr:ABC transporter substrate-binding protein [Hyphomicrobiales bacterium]